MNKITITKDAGYCFGVRDAVNMAYNASKKFGRVASEGLIGICLEGNSGAIVEVNSETDFVARNPEFQELVSSISKIALQNNGDQEKILSAPFPLSDKNVNDTLTDKIAKIGENLSLRRSKLLSVFEGIIAGCIHNSVNDNLGKIGVLIAIESDADQTSLNKLVQSFFKSSSLDSTILIALITQSEKRSGKTISRDLGLHG